MIVRTQAEWDALPARFEQFTVIEIRSALDFWLQIKNVPENSRVEAWGSSSVEAWESSRVVARGSSRVEARGSSSVEAWESSRVEAWGSSRVEARGSSSVEAWESSRVEAWESSRVVARGSSRVEAWGSSSVEAWGRSTSHQHSTINPNLHGQSVCFLYDKAAAPVRKSDKATIIQVEIQEGVSGWLEDQGIERAESIVLFKRVSKTFLTQEGTEHETKWVIGQTQTHANWHPTESECGSGKFHAVSRPYFGDQFRETDGDRYIAISVKLADLYAWPNPEYPHKIAFRECVVLHECDRWGDKIEGLDLKPETPTEARSTPEAT